MRKAMGKRKKPGSFEKVKQALGKFSQESPVNKREDSSAIYSNRSGKTGGPRITISKSSVSSSGTVSRDNGATSASKRFTCKSDSSGTPQGTWNELTSNMGGGCFRADSNRATCTTNGSKEREKTSFPINYANSPKHRVNKKAILEKRWKAMKASETNLKRGLSKPDRNYFGSTSLYTLFDGEPYTNYCVNKPRISQIATSSLVSLEKKIVEKPHVEGLASFKSRRKIKKSKDLVNETKYVCRNDKKAPGFRGNHEHSREDCISELGGLSPTNYQKVLFGLSQEIDIDELEPTIKQDLDAEPIPDEFIRVYLEDYETYAYNYKIGYNAIKTGNETSVSVLGNDEKLKTVIQDYTLGDIANDELKKQDRIVGSEQSTSNSCFYLESKANTIQNESDDYKTSLSITDLENLSSILDSILDLEEDIARTSIYHKQEVQRHQGYLPEIASKECRISTCPTSSNIGELNRNKIAISTPESSKRSCINIDKMIDGFGGKQKYGETLCTDSGFNNFSSLCLLEQNVEKLNEQTTADEEKKNSIYKEKSKIFYLKKADSELPSSQHLLLINVPLFSNRETHRMNRSKETLDVSSALNEVTSLLEINGSLISSVPRALEIKDHVEAYSCTPMLPRNVMKKTSENPKELNLLLKKGGIIFPGREKKPDAHPALSNKHLEFERSCFGSCSNSSDYWNSLSHGAFNPPNRNRELDSTDNREQNLPAKQLKGKSLAPLTFHIKHSNGSMHKPENYQRKINFGTELDNGCKRSKVVYTSEMNNATIETSQVSNSQGSSIVNMECLIGDPWLHEC